MSALVQPTLALAVIHAHPANPRHRAVADEEMVDSVRSLGILVPVTVAPAGDDQFVLIAGHRRYDAARKVGLDDVPVFVRDDLVTESQQLEAMLVENLHREDLTVVEEAEAYEQLTLAGMNVKAIAEATGRKASTVKARLKLNGLGESTREKLHDGQLTLVDAEALLEFADDPETTAELEEAIGSDNFRYQVQSARSRIERRTQQAATIVGFVAAGAVEVTSVPGAPGRVVKTGDETGEELQVAGMHMFSEDLRDPAAHVGCLGYVVPASQWQDPYLVCTDRGRHPAPEPEATPDPVESEWEKKRAEREALAARRAAADRVRVDWLVGHFTAMFPVRSHTDLAKAAKAFLPPLICLEPPSTALAAFELDAVAGGGWMVEEAALASYAATVTGLKPTGVIGAFARYLAALVAGVLNGDLEDADQALQQLNVWDWLKTAGYPMSDVDKEVRTEVEVHHTTLVNEAEAS